MGLLRIFSEGGAVASVAAGAGMLGFLGCFFRWFPMAVDRSVAESSQLHQLAVPVFVLAFGLPCGPRDLLHLTACGDRRRQLAAVCAHVAFFLLTRSKVFLLGPVGALFRWSLTLLPSSWRQLFETNWYTTEYVVISCAVVAMRPAGMSLLGRAPPAGIVAMMALGCVVTALVLNQWSEATRKGSTDHSVVQGFVQGTGTARQSLTWRQHARLAWLSFWDAVGQEMIWRALFMHELLACGCLSSGWCNVVQAVSFGTSHWYGIPSGLSGVALTFVYGWFLGWLVMTLDGMMVALLVHWSADYFIYAVIARKEF